MLAEATDKEILARILRNLTRAYTLLENYDKALTAAERITWLLPNTAAEYRLLGYLHYKNHAYGESIAAFETYLRLSDVTARCHGSRAKHTTPPKTTLAPELRFTPTHTLSAHQDHSVLRNYRISTPISLSGSCAVTNRTYRTRNCSKSS